MHFIQNKRLLPIILGFVLLFGCLTPCDSRGAQETLSRRTWKIGDNTREALLHIPANAKTNPAPVVFAFHGHGGSMGRAARMFHVHALWPEAIVVYMQGLNTPGRLTDPEGKKPGWQFAVGEQGDRDLKFFDAVLRSLKEDYKVDANRIYSTGHSNGGAFTYLLWESRAEHFAAVAPSASISPGARTSRAALFSPDTKKDAKPGTSGNRLIPILHVAGENDPLVKFHWQQEMINLLREQYQCGDGKPWEKDPRCKIYKSKDGAIVGTYIHPGKHEFPARGAEIILKFFQAHPKKDPKAK